MQSLLHFAQDSSQSWVQELSKLSAAKPATSLEVMTPEQKGNRHIFIWTNRSKESLTLDIKNRQASEILDRLLSKADVLVQNLAPSAMKN